MNYRHSYHAGNFADVFKHIVLIALIKSQLHKETGFCYIDTHAGIGLYDLLSDEAQKSKEFETGISKIYLQKETPPLIQEYIKCIQTFNPKSTIRLYPGSPLIVREFLRPQDHMILSELHPEDYLILKSHCARHKQIAVHQLDAYQSLKAFLPPKERRGVVLVDPPYEKPDEFSRLVYSLSQAVSRWETGIYAVWYPLTTQSPIIHFHRSLKEKIKRPLLITELSIYSEKSIVGLKGCGMVIINPPWKLDQQLEETLPWLWERLSHEGQGQYRLVLRE